MEPTITTPEPPEEAPAVTEEPEDTEASQGTDSELILMGDIELMAEGDVTEDQIRTITFADFINVRQRVKIQATVGDQAAKPVRTEAIAVKKTDSVKLTLEAVGGYAVESVKNGDTAIGAGGNGNYTIPAGDNTTVTIATAAVYTVKLVQDGSKPATGRGIVLDDSLKDAVAGDAADKLTVTADKTDGVTVKNAMDKNLTFTLSGAAASNTRTIVSYKPYDTGENDDYYKVIPAEPKDKTEGGTTTKVDTYTVSAAVLADLDGVITIKLEAESAQTITLGGDVAKVDVKIADPDAASDAADKFTKAFDTTNGEKVFVGGSLEFKAAMKADADANLEIVKVEKVVDNNTDEAEELTKSDVGVYTISVTEADKGKAVAIKITTDYKAANVKVLKFTLEEGDPDSATAEITKIVTSTPGASGAAAMAKTYSAEVGAENAIGDYAGLPGAAGSKVTTLDADEEFKLADNGTEQVTAVEVTVKPVSDYELKANTGETAPVTERVYKFGAGGTPFAAEGVNEIKASTQSVEKAGATYFKILPVTPGTGETVHVKLDAADISAATATDYTIKEMADTASTGIYQVKDDQRTVSFDIIADAGWMLDTTDLTGVDTVGSISDPVVGSDGKSTYTVTLRTVKLDTSTTISNADLGTLGQEAKTFSAAIVEPVKVGGVYEAFTKKTFTYTEPKAEGDATDPEPVEITDSVEIPYNSKLDLVLQAKNGRTFTGVTYTMDEVAGTEAAEIKNVTEAGSLVNQATLSIPHVTGDIEITVAVNEFGYELKDLTAVTGTTTPAYDKNDDRYFVNHEGSYVVGVTKDKKDVPSSKLTAVIRDGQTKVKQNKLPVAGGLQIDLANKNLAGKDITVTMYVDTGGKEPEAVGTYNLTVEEETTYITVKPEGGKDNEIAQRVDSEMRYAIDTDGVVKQTVTLGAGASDLIQRAYVENGMLVVVTKPVAKAAAMSGENPKEVTLTLSAADNEDVTQEVKVTVNSFFDKTKKPGVEPVTAADTVIDINALHNDVIADYSGLNAGALWYEITATAEPKKGSTADAPAFSTVADKLQEEVVKCVRLDGESQRVSLQVGQSDNLGEGDEWPYKLKARLVYVEDKETDYSERTVAFIEGQNGAVEISGEFESEVVSTQEPTFTAALKLKKGKATTLYTGQDAENSGELVAAIPEFKDKGFTANYQILDSDIEDVTAIDGGTAPIQFKINSEGKIVVTKVPYSAMIGKHVIKVTAAADEKTGHPMYASTATFTLNVVKGANDVQVNTPSVSIFKDAAARTPKAVTLKPSVVFNEANNDYGSGFWSKDAKGRTVTAPKSKKLTWSIVAADSNEDGYAPEADYLSSDKNKGVTINPSNGTVTVGKNFVVDKAHKGNNQFRIKAEVTNRAFPGNKEYGLSEVITITESKTDIGMLVIARPNYSEESCSIESYTVIAKQDTSSKAALKKALEVKAADIDGAEIFAMPAGTSVDKDKTYLYQEWRKLPLADLENITVTSTGKKVLEIYDDNCINVIAAGKKAGIKVTANDGSKAANTLNLNLGYTANDKEKDLALAISAATGQTLVENYETGEQYWDWEYPGEPDVYNPTGTVGDEITAEIKNTTGAVRLRVRVMVKGENGYEPADRYTNCTLKVSGGKVVKNDNYTADIVSNTKTTKLTLTDTYKDGTKTKKKVFTYTLTNKAFDFERSVKAPKVRVIGALHTYTDNIEELNNSVTLNVVDAATKAAPSSKLAKVEVDWSARTPKNEDALNAIDNAIDSGTDGKPQIFTLDKDGNMKLTFSENLYYDRDYNPKELPAGSYKLKVTVVNASGAVQGPPAAATLKVTKNKKFTFKPTTSYTIGKLDGAAMLTGKSNVNTKIGERVTVYWGKTPYNANVNGKSNNFTKFFRLNYDEKTEKTSLVATELLWAALEGKDKITVDGQEVAVPTLDVKKDLTGYVSYYASPSVNYYQTPSANDWSVVQGSAKITVKLAQDGKTGSKYTANKPDIALKAANGTNATTPINIMVGNEFVEVAYAAIDTNPKAKTADELELINEGGRIGVNEKGQIKLGVKKDKELKDKRSYNACLRIVPANSYYCAEIAKPTTSSGGTVAPQADNGGTPAASETPTTPEPGPTSQADLIQTYGIAVKVTVKGAAEPKVVTPDPVVYEPEPDVPDAEFTIDQAVAAINAVDYTGITVSNADGKDNAAKNALAGKVLTQAGTADLKNKFTVADKKDSTTPANSVVNITKATKSTPGSAVVTLVVTSREDSSVTRDVTITLTIAAVTVTTELQNAIDDAIDTAVQSNAITYDGTNTNWNTVSPNIIAAVENVPGVKDIFTVTADDTNPCVIDTTANPKTATIKLVLKVKDDVSDTGGTPVTITGVTVSEVSSGG